MNLSIFFEKLANNILYNENSSDNTNKINVAPIQTYIPPSSTTSNINTMKNNASNNIVSNTTNNTTNNTINPKTSKNTGWLPDYENNNIDIDRFFNVIAKVESTDNPYTKDNEYTGARGIHQMIPKTFNDLVQKYKLNYKWDDMKKPDVQKIMSEYLFKDNEQTLRNIFKNRGLNYDKLSGDQKAKIMSAAWYGGPMQGWNYFKQNSKSQVAQANNYPSVNKYVGRFERFYNVDI